MMEQVMVRFPAHPLPYHNEILSSYIYRLARARENLVSPFSILQLAGYAYSRPPARIKYNINTNSSQDNFELLANLTTFDKEIFKKMTIYRYNPVLLPEIKQSSHWDISNNFWFNASQLKVCPLCLKEKLYYRIQWKLQPVNACVKHRVLLIDTCQLCGQPIYDVDPKSRIIYPIGKCRRCGADFKQFKAVSLKDDLTGLAAQATILKILESRGRYRVTKDLSVPAKDFFPALKIFYRLIIKLKPSNTLIHKSGAASSLLKEVSHLFHVQSFYNSNTHLPPTKIPNVKLNYILYTSALAIFSNWPDNFFRLLHGARKEQTTANRNKGGRAFGLVERTHQMLTEESPHFIREAYCEWVRRHFNRRKCLKEGMWFTDPRLATYSGVAWPKEVRPDKLPLYLEGSDWEELKEMFHFPPKSAGDGAFYPRAVRRAQLFAGAFLYKLIVGCPWKEVPAVKKGLIKPHGLHERVWMLRRQGRLDKIIKKVLKVAKEMSK